MLRAESMRVAALVQDFLQLSRHRAPHLDSIDPVAPLERALSSSLAGNDRISVYRDFRHDGAHILGDAGLLQQAWGNIFTNAVQAMAGLERGELHVTSRCENDEIVLAVEDSGPGVPPEIMPRLFEPFFTTKPQGSGLGLSIAYRLVEANGGRLEALPPARTGARFVMRFARAESAAGAHTPEARLRA
jgi:two-component system NtrC family sensor kinase